MRKCSTVHCRRPKHIGKVVMVSLTPSAKHHERRFRWIVAQRPDGRFIVRAPKIGVSVRDLHLKRDQDFGPETLLPFDSIIHTPARSHRKSRKFSMRRFNRKSVKKSKSRKTKMSKSKIQKLRRASGLKVMRRNRLIRQGITPPQPVYKFPKENTLIYQDLLRLAKLHPHGTLEQIYGWGRWYNPRTGKMETFSGRNFALFQHLQKTL